ncbi:hypothetical protein PA25_19320 [Pseudoalteromonas sp. A25]|uniref:phage tail protein n=1 Tax=Pseudoalteromonas sp. A25 TaxID=116092 RepID=UPI0012608FAB|nr:phage tail protein [Pseudoalteromonas sp. A25]BBN81947.1 hypothetical protein PA25_19320 [Pseudoalteromonas sp. A25]
MSNSQYWTKLTAAGREKVLAAIANNQTIKLTDFAVGDGHISATDSDLRQPAYRSHVNSLKQLSEQSLVEVVGVVPASEGGFYVREAAFYTDDGKAFAIIKYPETYKPAAADNAAAELGIKAVIDVIDAQVVSEKIDPSMIYSTKEWVSEQIATTAIMPLEKRTHAKNIGVDLTGQVQQIHHRKSVIALCELTNTDISANSYSSGRLVFHRQNGVHKEISAEVTLAKIYNQTNARGHLLTKGTSDAIKLCTFEYNGIKYAGVHFFYDHAEHGNVTFDGVGTFDPFGLDYFETQNNTALIQEVADTLSFDDIQLDNPLKWNNHEIYHEGHKPTPSEIGAVAKGESIDLTDQRILWSQNSDGASIGFKNIADTDPDSYLYFKTADNHNEYFKWIHQVHGSNTEVEWMSLKPTGLTVSSNLQAKQATFDNVKAKNATFDNGDATTTVNIRSTNNHAAILNVCAATDSQTTGIVYVGQSPKHGGGIEYNGDNNPVTSGSGADYFTLFRRNNGDTQWTARNIYSNNDWEFRAEVKAASFKEGNTPLANKYHAKSDKLAEFENSNFKLAGQDLKIHHKRALVGLNDKLVINYGTTTADWDNVEGRGKWTFTDQIKIKDVNLKAVSGAYGDKALEFSNSRGYLKLGAQNPLHCHYETNMPHHWFNKDVRVDGEIYAGENYGDRVYHEGHKPTPSEIGAVAKGESINLTNQELIWHENTDGAAIGFQNISDNDTNSYLYFKTSDNGNEFFKWIHRTTDWMSLKASGLRIKGDVKASGATFDNGDNTTVNIRANDNGAAVLNVCAESDSQTTGIVYVGQSPKHGGGIEYNGDNNPVTSGSGADYFTLFRRNNGDTQWTARNIYSNNDWEFRAEVKAASFKEGNTPLATKYHPKSDKLAKFETSNIDTNGDRDLLINSKRALVGLPEKLVINYGDNGSDWNSVEGKGNWQFTGDVAINGDLKMSGPDCYIWTPNTVNGYTGIWDTSNSIAALKYTNGASFDFGADINITKNNPWLTLHSNQHGARNEVEQAAGISLGESGREDTASLHLSYIGNGYSYIGMGAVGADNIPDNWAMQMHYGNTWVNFRGDIHLGSGNTKLSKGTLNALRVSTYSGYVDIGPMNADFCHFQTDRSQFYFDKRVNVKGELYAGPDYNKKVYHQGHKPTATDIGAVEQHWGVTPTVSKNEFTTIAQINGSNLASSITLQLKGTTDSTVVNVKADLLVDHHKGIFVDAMCGGYTPIQLCIRSNEHEKYIVQAKTLSGNPLSLLCIIQSHTQDAVSIGNYSTNDYMVVHTHTTQRNKRSLSSNNGTGLFVDGNSVLHTGNISQYSERRIVKTEGALAANSKNHLTASNTFKLPAVTGLGEGTTVVVSKALAATPTIEVEGSNSEHIAMMRGTTLLTDTSVQFDIHCTLTFILNSDKHWEMQ